MGQAFAQEAEGLWAVIHELSESERLSLLAHCVSLTVNALRTRGTASETLADTLAREVGLDMTGYWQATASNYFGRVSKRRIAKAVRQGVSDQAAQKIAGLKKQAMAEAAVVALAGKGWLPPLLSPAPTPLAV